MLHIENYVIGMTRMILLPPNMVSGVYTTKLHFGHDLISVLLWVLLMVTGKLKLGLNMC